MRSIAKLSCFRHINWNPGAGDLRRFAASMLIGFAALGLVAAWKSGTPGNISMILWGIGLVLAVAALVPHVGRAVYLAVYLVTGVLGWVVSHLILVLLYYLLFTPLALILRLTGTDLLSLRNTGASMWRAAERDTDPAGYYRQF